jgi:hypothetical protein
MGKVDKSLLDSKVGKKMLGYSALAGAFLATGQEADAQVVYTDVDPDSTVALGQFDIDFDGDGVVDFFVLQFGDPAGTGNIGVKLAMNSTNTNTSQNSVMGTLGSLSYVYPSRLDAGVAVELGAPFVAFSQVPALEASLFFSYNTGGTAYGNWGGGAEGYLGVKFVAGAGTAHFGWIELAVAADGGSATVKSYAFESSELVAINTGDTGVPSGFQQEISNLLAMDVFPNPVVGNTANLRLTADKNLDIEVALVNTIGEVLFVRQQEIVAGNNQVELSFSDLPAGTYFVRVRDEEHVGFQKVLKVD